MLSPIERSTSPEIFEMSPFTPELALELYHHGCQNEKPLLYSFPMPCPQPLCHTSLGQPQKYSSPSRGYRSAHAKEHSPQPIQKITGFIPVVESHVSEEHSSPLGCLSPPPISSFSSSPWILPGSCDSSDDETASPTSLEFDKYLIQCIESEKRPLLCRGTHFPSVRVALCK
jgi:hypothetical protein